MTIINLTIDEKDITVPKGTNIFMAAKDNGIYIPGLCYHPKLTQYGGCRLCMVEVTERGRTRHRFSCAQPVSEGMEVKTQTPKVTKFTKSVMEFLLAHHPLDCPTCDKSGECGLQDVTHDLKLGPGRFKTVRMNEPMRRDNPLLEYNTNRCILCGRCVKVCKEVEGVGAIDFQNRGIKTVIGTAFNKPLDCSFCGGCVSVCPTGSWQDRTLKFRARPWELKKTPSICTYCAVGCTVIVNTKNDNVMRMTSDDDLGINEGNLCVKGKFGHEFINSNRRVKTPLIRKTGILCPTTWAGALDYISKRFGEIINEHGGKAIGGIGSEKCTNEDNYLFQKFCRSVLGTNNIDNMANIKSPSLNRLIRNSVENGLAATSLKEIENANTVFFVGADITEAHPVIGNMTRKAVGLNNTNLIIANVRNVVFNSTAKNDIRLNYNLGTQTALINALIKVIVDEGLIDLNMASTSTENFEELQSQLQTLNINKLSKLTNISEENIRNASALLTKPGTCYIVCGKDIEEDPLGKDTVKALMNLCALLNTNGTGKVSLVFSRSNNNSQGVNDMGVVPDYLPGYLDIDDASKDDSLNVFDLASKNKIKALYVMGENPIVNYPNGKKVKEAFQKADFTVVQDTFLTETAQLADVVLPSVTFAEKEGTFTNMGMTVQRLNKAIQPMGEAKPDWQIICDLARKMGHSFSYASTKEILNEIGDTVPIYKGINHNRLEQEVFRWASLCNTRDIAKYKFKSTESAPLDIKSNKKFPFILLTGSSLNHQGTFSRNSSSLVAVAPDCFVEMNRKDAQAKKIKDGDMVVIGSTREKLTLKAKTTNRVPEGVVFVSEDYEWIHVNILCDKKYTNVRISKA
ncbi:MAG: molybdopterin-dependent oxidoreductase [Planctomycetota bacterium]|jgi:formate dehydrogenase alpha subunit